jgi:hypothetical protein
VRGELLAAASELRVSGGWAWASDNIDVAACQRAASR